MTALPDDHPDLPTYECARCQDTGFQGKYVQTKFGSGWRSWFCGCYKGGRMEVGYWFGKIQVSGGRKELDKYTEARPEKSSIRNSINEYREDQKKAKAAAQERQSQRF